MSDREDGIALPAGHRILEAGPVSLASSVASWIRASRSAASIELGKVALMGGVYYVAALLSCGCPLVGGQVTPIWPPTGVALAGICCSVARPTRASRGVPPTDARAEE